MNRKQLGNSHLSVTPMGLGLAALGRPGYINLGHGDDLNYNHDVTAMEAQAHRVLEIEFDGVLLFSTVQATWNLLEQSAASALREAHEAGMGVIVKEGLANGRLTSRNDSPEFQRKMVLLQARAETQNTTVDSMALAAVINQPFVDVVLSGAACVEHLKSNLQALKIKWSDSLAEMLDALVEPAESYWHIRSQLAWN